MSRSSLTMLDYTNYQTNKMPRKLSKISMHDLHQAYVPAQPVLSSRTVDIDLPGTRTYRQKSTLDILEDHQKLVREWYRSKRIPASAPSRRRRVVSPRPLSDRSLGSVQNAEKCRPFTSGEPFDFQHEHKGTLSVIHNRPKTTGQYKQVLAVANSYMTFKEDSDMVALSQSSQDLHNRLRSYWNSEKKSLVSGKFVRGQKRPEDVSPSLRSWLTFGGVAGAHGGGIIDVFASFKDSDEHYKIEGSVGSQVARQLQKGGKIRIGINGVQQTQKLQVIIKEKKKDNMEDVKVQKIKDETGGADAKSQTPARESSLFCADPENEQKIKAEQEVRTESVLNIDSSESQSEDDFKELIISAFDDFQNKTPTVTVKAQQTQKQQYVHVDPVSQSPKTNDQAVKEVLSAATPLSWGDQCSKPNIKLIQASVSYKETWKPVASQTIPVRFERLVREETRPQFAETDGYKIKQRTAQNFCDGKGSSSKVKVVYIDPLSQEEEEKLNSLSVDEIINQKLDEKKKENQNVLLTKVIKDIDDKATNMSTKQDIFPQAPWAKSNRSEHELSRQTSYKSFYMNQGGIKNPKLVVTPAHTSTSYPKDYLQVMSVGTGNTPNSKSLARTGKNPGKVTPVKLFPLTSAGKQKNKQTCFSQSETEYIKITSQLKFSTSSAPVDSSHSSILTSPQSFPDINTSKDLDYHVIDSIHLKKQISETSSKEPEIIHANTETTNIKPATSDVNENENHESPHNDYIIDVPEPIVSTIPPINIPTADEGKSFYKFSSQNMTSDKVTNNESDVKEKQITKKKSQIKTTDTDIKSVTSKSTIDTDVKLDTPNAKENNCHEKYQEEYGRHTKEPDSVVLTTTPINIPTAEEESFYHLSPRNVTSDNIKNNEPEIQDLDGYKDI